MGEVIDKAAEVATRLPEKAATAAGQLADRSLGAIDKASQRVLNRIRQPGRNPEEVLKELASAPKKKYEFTRTRMLMPVKRDEEEDRRRASPEAGGSHDTQIGLINIHG